ncbi:MAG TPA: hypothetical protein VGG97_14980 [Bryobacteraceae bacterium]|jgi:hypothetical protein
MSKLEWARSDAHPPAELLLRYLELDLPADELAQLDSHLRGCWHCSAELQNLKQGVWSFIEFREKVLFPSVPSDIRLNRVRQALVAASMLDRHRPAQWTRVIRDFFNGAAFRPAWIAGVASIAALFAFVYLSTLSPTPLLADEFIHNVRNSLEHARKSESGKLVLQKVRLRRGGLVIDKEITRGGRTIPRTAAADVPIWFGRVPSLLAWEDPLNFDSFLQWRARQTTFHESVSTEAGLVTLCLTRTQPDAALDTNVLEVLLTVRKLDWHIIRKRLAFRNGPDIEVTETAYSVTEQPASAAPSRRETSGLTAKTAHSSSPLLPLNPEDLDRAELRVRKVLFQQQTSLAAAEAVPSLTRTRRFIRIDGVISTPSIRFELAHALAAIPYTSDQIKSAVSFDRPVLAARRTPVVISKPDDREIVEPPLLRKRLVQTLGSEMEATQFANRVLEESGKSFALTVQLRDLARRFSLPEEQRLPASLRVELGSLTHEIESALRKQLNDEAALLTPVLGNEPPQEPKVDQDWHARADTLFRLAALKEKSVSRLFAVTGHAPALETPVDVEVSQLRKYIQDMTASIPGR